MIRAQLPAYSPLSVGRLGAAALQAARAPDSVRSELRRELVARFGAEHAFLTGSGTEALQLALKLSRVVRPGSSGIVALPAYSCYDVVSAAVGAGVQVVFYDVDPTSLSPDMESLRTALQSGVSAVVAGYLFGFPLDWGTLRTECKAAGSLLIEDAAQGLGSGWGGTEAGSFGDLTVLSFGRGKGWTGGGGGALLTRVGDGSVIEHVVDGLVVSKATASESVRAAALSAAQWCLGRPWLYGLASWVPGTGLGETHYREPEAIGAMPAFCAAAVSGHAGAARSMVGVRRDWARRWDAMLDGLGSSAGVRRCAPLAPAECGFLRYPVLVDSPERTKILALRGRPSGVARAYPLPLPALEASAAITVAGGASQPGAERLAASLLTLPTHALVSDRDVDETTRSVR